MFHYFFHPLSRRNTCAILCVEEQVNLTRKIVFSPLSRCWFQVLIRKIFFFLHSNHNAYVAIKFYLVILTINYDCKVNTVLSNIIFRATRIPRSVICHHSNHFDFFIDIPYADSFTRIFGFVMPRKCRFWLALQNSEKYI